MATIKSFTDLSQSKKLAEILPLKSADYCWGIDDETLNYNNSPYPCAWKDYSCKEYYIPCWSLAALLDIIKYYDIEADDGIIIKRKLCYEPYQITTRKHNDIINACIEMILKLKESDLL